MKQRLYFAYGSNMDLNQMRGRCPAARRAGTGSVADMRFLINGRGYATVRPKRGATVHGLLWHITPECEQSLDDYEGVASGCYHKEQVMVDTGRGAVEAMVYVDAVRTPGFPRPGYLELVLRAARRINLPQKGFDHYLAWLAQRAS